MTATADGGTAPGRRELKKLATREAVRAAAVRLAITHGVENVTVERIAEAADVSLRTFFNHYSSKEEAVFAAAEARAAELITEFRGRPVDEPMLGALREATLTVLGRDDTFGRDHLAVLRLLRGAPSLLARQMVVMTEQEASLAAAVADRLGTGAGDRLPQIWSAAALAALRIALDRWLVRAGDTDGDRRVDLLREEIDAGLALLAGGLDHR
ncbi:MAG: TetR family transcriptional regulator [Pseudonocardia sediminis]